MTDASVDHPVDETATFANSISFTNSPVKKEKKKIVLKKSKRSIKYPKPHTHPRARASNSSIRYTMAKVAVGQMEGNLRMSSSAVPYSDVDAAAIFLFWNMDGRDVGGGVSFTLLRLLSVH